MPATDEPSALLLTIFNAVILTMAPGSRAPVRGWLQVGRDGRIAAIGEGQPPSPAGDSAVPGAGVPRTAVDAGGALVAPGFVSAHSHLFTSASRGLGTDESLYGWVEAMTRYTRHADPDDIYWLTTHGALDFLSHGVTTAYDFADSRLRFTSVAPGVGGFGGELRPAAYTDNQLQAKVDAGIRFVHSVMLDDPVGDGREIVDRFEASMMAADRFSGHPLCLRLALSGGVQWTERRDTADLEVEAMRRFGVLNQPHFLETPHELAEQRSRFAWYRRAGALGPDLIFGHFVHATPEMITEAGAEGCAMSWQPGSNGRLASGVADIPALRAAGVRVGVGLDDQACTDNSDPWQNLRIGIALLRATTHDPASMPVADMLELHTLGSARALGVEADVGSLEVGKYADLLVVDPRDPDTGPVWDPYGTYVLACGQRNLKRVYVGGRLVAVDGRPVHRDPTEVSTEVHRRCAVLAQRAAG